MPPLHPVSLDTGTSTSAASFASATTPPPRLPPSAASLGKILVKISLPIPWSGTSISSPAQGPSQS
uniref:Uncharacterized protein n=1 Tax=Setaria viridis TaxID=4556 RepID=A0A4V6D5C7_SETVI|nr:hypothetical protein SEVIR_6G133600v2 [Setaria viridis]